MKKFVIALGFFDSIHIGHRYLLKKAREIADNIPTKLMVLTFDDDFLSVLNRNSKEIYLFGEKREIMLSLGVDIVEKLPSSKEFLQFTKYEFLQYLEDNYNPSVIVAGSDYKFGYKAQGDVSFLVNYFKNSHANVQICDLLKEKSDKVASSNIRLLLSKGKIEQANELLLEPYFITGTVERGYNIGSKLSYPTANMYFNDHKLIPKLGVYAVIAEVEAKKYKGIANIGNRPTFEGHKIKIETFILDFNGDIYGKKIKIYLKKYIREIVKFNNAKQLKVQIAKDIKIVTEVKDD